MNLLVHIEQYDVVGILPSQLESLQLLAQNMGVENAAFIDNTLDGFKNRSSFKRYKTLDDFLGENPGPRIVFSPGQGETLKNIRPKGDEWLVFGPSMGFPKNTFDGLDVTWSHIPYGVLNSRDAVPIALWELSKWVQ